LVRVRSDSDTPRRVNDDDDDAPVVVFEEMEPVTMFPVVVENVIVEQKPMPTPSMEESKTVDPWEYVLAMMKQQPELRERLLNEFGLAPVEKKPVENRPVLIEEPVQSEEVVEEAGEACFEQKEEDQMVHDNIMCDHCKCNPIVGIRFKCTICNDFDLCSDCEAKEVHPTGHPLMKIKVRKEKDDMSGVWRRKCPMAERKTRGPRRCMAKSQRLYAKFIGDSTIQDRSYLAPGSQHIKTWEMLNTGFIAWPAGVKVQLLSGDRDVIDASSMDITLPEVQPNEGCFINLIVNAPEKPGRYITYFRLVSPTGTRFGPRFWLDFFVPEPEPVVEQKAVEAVAVEVANNPIDKGYARSLQRWGDQLMELSAMGLGEDASLNVFLLEKFQGDVARVVNWYLDQRRI